jgi:hypothetical protein
MRAVGREPAIGLCVESGLPAGAANPGGAAKSNISGDLPRIVRNES